MERELDRVVSSEITGDLKTLLEKFNHAKHLGAELTKESQERLVRFALLVEAWGERIQLTARPSAKEVMLHRIFDSLHLSMYLPGWSSLSDIGSGAGFPGIPLACLYPERQVMLIESREKRHYFLRHVKRELALPQVKCVKGRAERLNPEPTSLVLAQAVASPEKAQAFCLPWVAKGGWLGIPLSQRQKKPKIGEGQFSQEHTYLFEAFDGRQRAIWLAQVPR